MYEMNDEGTIRIADSYAHVVPVGCAAVAAGATPVLAFGALLSVDSVVKLSIVHTINPTMPSSNNTHAAIIRSPNGLSFRIFK